jgi:hypothetical protein
MSDVQTFWNKWPIWRITMLGAGFPFTVFLTIHFWTSWTSGTWWLMLAAIVCMWIGTANLMIRDWRSMAHGRPDGDPSR